MNAEELHKIITSIQNATQNAGLEPSADAILTSAVDYYVHNEKEKNWDKRAENNPKQGQSSFQSDKITPKQINMLKRLGFEGSFDNLTKKEASQLIDEMLKNKGGRDNASSESNY